MNRVLPTTIRPQPTAPRCASVPARGAAAILAVLLALLLPAAGHADAGTPFHVGVDLRPLGGAAVLVEGRLKSFGSHAASTMHLISGPRSINGQSPAFTYLDMLIRPEAYRDADVIFVKNKAVRQRLAELLRADDPSLATRLATFERRGLISRALLEREVVQESLRIMEADLIRTARPVGEIRTAVALSDPRLLINRLRIIPPAIDDREVRWHSMDELVLPEVPGALIEGIDPALQREIRRSWRDLVTAWQAGDAEATSEAAATLAAKLPRVNPEIYPDQARLSWEHWYFQQGNLTWIWLVYLASVVILLVGSVYRWPTARRLGMVVFGIALGLQTFALLLRWYVSGRWPNSNMFEAVTTAAWFGAVGALFFEYWVRRSVFSGFFALAAAVSGMVAMMAAHFLPIYLNPNIANMMPVLHDVWLYIHVNVIIFSYCLIFMAAVSAAIYLVHRLFGGPPAYARAGGAGFVMATRALPATAGAPATYALAGAGAGGGEAAVLTGAPTATAPARRTPTLGEVLDGVTMVLLEVAVLLLWAGLVMGAIWADHSWGRPWGWDPKEVFSLETFIVFLVLVHIRWRSKDKGLWTAVLALVGAAVMLFNWIVVNFVITGLHSYA